MADQQAGWYPDPSGDATQLRYWDGNAWTNDFTATPQAAQPVAPVQAQPVQPVQPVAAPQPVQPVTPVQPAQPAVYVSETTYTNPVGQQATIDQVYVQAPAPQSNGLAIGALICGIAGLCIGISSIVAIILGVMGRKNPNGRGMATAGLILGIIGLAGWIIYLIFFIIAFAASY